MTGARATVGEPPAETSSAPARSSLAVAGIHAFARGHRSEMSRSAALALQRTAGNRAVGSLLTRSKPPQPEGAVGGQAGEVPASFIGPLQAGDVRAVPHNFVGPLPPDVVRSASFHPTINVVNAGSRVSDCGAYSYKVRWGIPASERTGAGWVVQRVDINFDVTDCANNPVTPAPIDDPANYPFWEAWEYTSGQNVWVGPASGRSRHSGDTFSGGDYGPGTKGKVSLLGEVKAIDGFAPPAGMTVRNAEPAWGLPYTKAEPVQFRDTLPGAQHTLTAEWNCCPRGTVASATTVTTNP